MIPSRMSQIREKRHRLPPECYRGEVTVAFTACIDKDYRLFTDAQLVDAFIERLDTAAKKHQCIVFVYCFMPEHQHLVVHGMARAPTPRRAMVDYKQLTGFWLSGVIIPGSSGRKTSTTTSSVPTKIWEPRFVTWPAIRCVGVW